MSGGRLALLGRVDLCPADPRILRDVGSEREDVLECAANQAFLLPLSTALSRKSRCIGPGSVVHHISNITSTWKGRTFELDKVNGSLKPGRRNSINRPDCLKGAWMR